MKNRNDVRHEIYVNKDKGREGTDGPRPLKPYFNKYVNR